VTSWLAAYLPYFCAPGDLRLPRLKAIRKMAEKDNKSGNETLNENQKESTVSEGEEQAGAKKETELTPEQKYAELNDKYMRLYADFDNFRKRSIKERAEYLKYAGEEAWKMLLPVVDDFERSIKANEQVNDAKGVMEGVRLVYHKLTTILKQAGVEAMDSIGKEFNAETMEAITNIPAPSPDLKGKVVDEVEKGYLFNGKVIRYAKVVVGN
jgi:molecular chaperone GrpE